MILRHLTVLGLMMLLDRHAVIAVTKSDCCPGDNLLIRNKCKVDNITDITVRLDCQKGMFLLDPSLDSSEEFTVNSDGDLMFETDTFAAKQNEFCVGNKYTVDSNGSYVTTRVALVCFADDYENESYMTFAVMAAMTITSVVFLVLTLLVYVIVAQLRDHQGKCIMCLCGSLAMGFLHLGFAQIAVTRTSDLCLVIAFSMYFWLIAAFFWMNIVSITVMRSVLFRNSTISENRMFLYYNIYGWGSAFLLLLITIIAHYVDGQHVKPGFGNINCWFEGRVQTWSYFYGPIATLLVINVVLFFITCQRLWYKTSYENVTKLRSMKYKVLLYIKLFIITGISWVFEILSFAHDQKNTVWLIADTFNALQGVVYFLVLIAFRKRALRGLAQRGCPIPCASKTNVEVDEECDEIVGEEEVPAMTIVS